MELSESMLKHLLDVSECGPMSAGHATPTWVALERRGLAVSVYRMNPHIGRKGFMWQLTPKGVDLARSTSR